MAIKVTPSELQNMATQLEGFKGQIADLASKLDTAVNNVLSAWEGDAQKQYAEDYNALKPALSKQLPDFIEKMAKNATARANAYLEADKRV